MNQRESSRMSISALSFVHQFVSSCGDTCIGGPDRRLSQRMPKHIPKWLIKSMSQNTVDGYAARETFDDNQTHSLPYFIPQTCVTQ